MRVHDLPARTALEPDIALLMVARPISAVRLADPKPGTSTPKSSAATHLGSLVLGVRKLDRATADEAGRQTGLCLEALVELERVLDVVPRYTSLRGMR